MLTSPVASVGYVAAIRESLDRRAKKIQALRDAFERVVGAAGASDLDRLMGTLQLYARRIDRRGTR
jgi:hypothetical protein